MVNAVVPIDRLEAETANWNRDMLKLWPIALRMIKAGFNTDTDGLAGIQELADNPTGLFYMSAEGQEGRNAWQTVAVNAILGVISTVMREAMRDSLEVGFRVLKIKIGAGPLRDEIDHLQQMCTALSEGVGVGLCLDTNGEWDEADARRLFAACRTASNSARARGRRRVHRRLQPGERLRADRLRPPRAFHRPGFLSRPCHSRLVGERHRRCAGHRRQPDVAAADPGSRFPEYRWPLNLFLPWPCMRATDTQGPEDLHPR